MKDKKSQRALRRVKAQRAGLAAHFPEGAFTISHSRRERTGHALRIDKITTYRRDPELALLTLDELESRLVRLLVLLQN